MLIVYLPDLDLEAVEKSLKDHLLARQQLLPLNYQRYAKALSSWRIEFLSEQTTSGGQLVSGCFTSPGSPMLY